MSEYAKAIAGAVTALIVFVAAEIGLDLPDEVSAALVTLITAGIVYWVPNRVPSRDDVKAAVMESGRR